MATKVKKPRSRDSADRDSVGAYLEEIGRYQLLDKDGEARLGLAVKLGREAAAQLDDAKNKLTAAEQRRLTVMRRKGGRAREDLACANLRLVVSIARRYLGTRLPMGDLIQLGNVGLLRAVELFDFEKGFKFSTYATWWIRQAISRGLSDSGRTIRLPVHVEDDLRLVLRTADELETQAGHRLPDEELAIATGLPAPRVAELRSLPASVASIDQPIGDESDGSMVLGDTVGDDNEEFSDSIINNETHQSIISNLIKLLTPREQRIVELRFGLNGNTPLTLDKIGVELGITRERVRQIEARLLSKLRHPSLAWVEGREALVS